jgi:hypothetical protein
MRGVMAFCTDRGTFQELYRVWLIVTFGLLAFPVFFLEWLLREEKLDVAKYRCLVCLLEPWFHLRAGNVSDTKKTHVLHGQGCKPAFLFLLASG